MRIRSGWTPTLCWPITRQRFARDRRDCAGRAMLARNITTPRTGEETQRSLNIGEFMIIFYSA